VLIGAGGGAATMGLTWLLLLRDHRAALWKIERIIGRDLTGDGVVGEPEPERQQEPIRVEVTEIGRHARLRTMRFATLPESVTDEDMVAVAQTLVIEQCAFSRRGLSDVLTDDAYSDLVAAMLKGKLLKFRNGKNDRSGYALTPSGWALMQEYVVVGGGGDDGGGGGE
jgi:hypothetical protein